MIQVRLAVGFGGPSVSVCPPALHQHHRQGQQPEQITGVGKGIVAAEQPPVVAQRQPHHHGQGPVAPLQTEQNAEPGGQRGQPAGILAVEIGKEIDADPLAAHGHQTEQADQQPEPEWKQRRDEPPPAIIEQGDQQQAEAGYQAKFTDQRQAVLAQRGAGEHQRQHTDAECQAEGQMGLQTPARSQIEQTEQCNMVQHHAAVPDDGKGLPALHAENQSRADQEQQPEVLLAQTLAQSDRL